MQKDYEQDIIDRDQRQSSNKQYQQQQSESDEYIQLQSIIVSKMKTLQSSSQFQNNISQQLEQKYRKVQLTLAGKSQQETVNIRMHLLAMSKILVMTHGKHQFRLVQAHSRMGQAYLAYQCYQQAQQHLLIALKKNSKLFQQIKQTKQYHAIILTMVGKCQLQQGKIQGALDMLNKALEIQTISKSQYQNHSIKTLIYISNCYTKAGSYDNAVQYMQKVIQLHKGKQQSKALAMAQEQLAKIYSIKGDFYTAQIHQTKVTNILIQINYNKPQYLAEQYNILSGYQEKSGNLQGLIDSIRKAKTIYQQILQPSNQKILKTKRKLSLVLLRNDRHQAALQQLLQIYQLQQKYYGQSSVQAGKTHKIIGTIYLSLHKTIQAMTHLKKALKIYQDNMMKKGAQEIKKSIQLAKSHNKKKQDEQR